MSNLIVRVYKPDQHPEDCFQVETTEGFRIGRQVGEEPEAFALAESASEQSELKQKLVIASASERNYSRFVGEVRINDDSIVIKNTSQQPIVLKFGEMLELHESTELSLPAEFSVYQRRLTISNLERNLGGTIFSLPTTVSPPGARDLETPALSLIQASRGDNVDSKRLLDLLQTMISTFQDSPNGPAFFERATRAMINLLELDHALIAFSREHLPDSQPASGTINDSEWIAQSQQSADGNDAEHWQPSSSIFKRVKETKSTIYQVPDLKSDSLMDVKCVVASPLMDSSGNVIGVIYGDRRLTSIANSVFSESEAMSVELFANAISSGMERLNQERELTEIRSRFDQFFAPELADQLTKDDSILKARSADVSVLFADIRGFSRISERIGPEQTIQWIQSVMSQLANCVFEFEGVVVNYIGDEIMAMWGAPVSRSNHAELAVRAGLKMIEMIPIINEQWKDVVGETFDIGIGVNTGEAQVGNTGSDRHFKYGPLGGVVNISSRLQGSTKQIHSRFMVTKSTASQLPADIHTRNLRAVRFVNVKEAIEVYEVPFEPDEAWMQLKSDYEEGLNFYKNGQLAEATQKMASIINKFPNDRPSLQLLSDSVRSLSIEPEAFDPVWNLSQK